MAPMIAMTSLVLLALLQNIPAPPAAAVLDDVRAMTAATTNEARFEALTALLKTRNLPFEIEPFTIEKALGREPRTAGRNIVVTVGEGPGEIVVGAHYDAVRLQDGTLSRGAVDNAASSVLLVHLAVALREERLPARVRIAWFDMEELGLIGSAQFVKRHTADRISTMLNFDVNAYGDTILYGPAVRPDNAALRRTFVETCAAEDIPCLGFAQMPPGDDRSFVAAGIPTLSVAILPGAEAHQLWLMMNAGANAGLAQGTVPAVMRTLHTPEDTIEKVSGDSVTTMLRFARALVRGIARR